MDTTTGHKAHLWKFVFGSAAVHADQFHARVQGKIDARFQNSPFLVKLLFKGRKPVLRINAAGFPAPDWFMSLTHSGNEAYALLAPFPVGIDVEKIESNFLYESAALSSFSQGEIDHLFSLESEDERVLYFHQLWTLKEAFYKAGSYPFSDALEKCVIRMGENNEIDADLAALGCSDAWKFSLKQMPDSSLLAIAAQTAGVFAICEEIIYVSEAIKAA